MGPTGGLSVHQNIFFLWKKEKILQIKTTLISQIILKTDPRETGQLLALPPRILYKPPVYKIFFPILSSNLHLFFSLQETKQKIWCYCGIYNFVIGGIFTCWLADSNVTAPRYIAIDGFYRFCSSSIQNFFSLPLQEAVTDPQCLFQDELKCYSLENFLLPSHVSCGSCSLYWKEESCAVKMLDGVSHSNRLYISNLDTHISKFVSKICLQPDFFFLTCKHQWGFFWCISLPKSSMTF